MKKCSRWTKLLGGPHGEELERRSGKDKARNPRRAETVAEAKLSRRERKRLREVERRYRHQKPLSHS